MRAKKQRIGDVLLERGVLKADELEQALQLQRQSGQRLGEVLVQHLGISKSEIAFAIEQVQGVAYAECPPASIAPQCLALVPRATAVKCRCLPLSLSLKGNVLILAMAEPQNLDFIDEVRFRSGKQVSPRFSYKEDIETAIRKFYDGEDIGDSKQAEAPATESQPAPVSEPEMALAPIIDVEPIAPAAPTEDNEAVSTTDEPPEPSEVNSLDPKPLEVMRLTLESEAVQQHDVPSPEVLSPQIEQAPELEPEPEPEPPPPPTPSVVTMEQEPETQPEPPSQPKRSTASEAADNAPGDDLTGVEFVVRGPWRGLPETKNELSSGARKTNPALRSVAQMLLKVAENEGAHVHIEPQARGTSVKIRVNDMVSELADLPGDARDSMVSMIKTLACLNNAGLHTVSHGSFGFGAEGRQFDIHVSVLPTHYGEKLFLRRMNPQTECPLFSDLGLDAEQVATIEGVLKREQGIVLVAGPPGSGRTRLLAAVMNHLRSSNRSLVSVEETMEYVIEGASQIQLGPRFDREASACLRSVLRQDPQVIMIEELRDPVTAELALRASRRSLLMSVLNAEDGADALSRLRDFGVPQSLIASVSAIVSPRLLRTRCSCGREPGKRLRSASNCGLCKNTGYHGSTGVFEIMVVEGAVRAAVEDGNSAAEIRDILRGTAVRTLHEDAMEKVMDGVTTLDEVLTVLPRRKEDPYPTCRECSEPLSQVFRYCPYCGCAVAETPELVASGTNE